MYTHTYIYTYATALRQVCEMVRVVWLRQKKNVGFIECLYSALKSVTLWPLLYDANFQLTDNDFYRNITNEETA